MSIQVFPAEKKLPKVSQLRVKGFSQLVNPDSFKEFYNNMTATEALIWLEGLKVKCIMMEVEMLNLLMERLATCKVSIDKNSLMISTESTYVKVGTKLSAKVALMEFNSTWAKAFYINGETIPIKDGVGEYEYMVTKPGSEILYAKALIVDPYTGDSSIIHSMPLEWVGFECP